MVSKTVKIEDPYILTFFYPQFVVVDEISFIDRDRDVIYVGSSRKNLVPFLRENTRSFINTVGIPDIDFSDRVALTKWAFESKGKPVRNKILEQVKGYDEDYFLYLIKIFWVLGKWVDSYDEDDVTLFNLFQSSVSSLKEELVVYFKLLDKVPPQVIESSFLTFLSRVYNIEDQSVSNAYLRLLKQALARYGPKIKPVVYKLALRKDVTPELAFLDMVTDLR